MMVEKARSDGSEITERDDQTVQSAPDGYLEKQMKSIAYVRCRVHKEDLFMRNETFGFVEVTGAYVGQEDDEAEYFHPCGCTDYYDRQAEYCPTNLPVCIVHGRDGPVQCLSRSGPASFAQVLWPPGFFYVCLVLLVLLMTRKSGYIYHYVRRKVSYRNNEEEYLIEQANRILAQEGRPHLLGRDFVRREEQRMRLEERQQQQSGTTPKLKRKKVQKPVVLRTKSFSMPQSSSSSSSDDASNHHGEGDDHECAICLGLLEDGDVVGDIPCGHLFHKECLKTWVKRKTRCPLCQDNALVCDPPRDGAIDKETEVPSSGQTLGLSESETISDVDLEEQAPTDQEMETPSESDFDAVSTDTQQEPANAEDRV